MIRAGVFIGVDQTGNLQKLNDAATGAKRMHAWAVAQGMPDKTHAKLITDEAGKVSCSQVFAAINEIIDGPGVDQLIVYFAGHGVNINLGERWLLSDAPRNPNEAVNVRGSVEMARYCGINHVVIFSDACRVAPDGIQAGNVHGQEVFPNEGGGAKAKPVDQFFACVLGRTAAEIKDPAQAAGTFRALYTDALLDALYGHRDEPYEASTVNGDNGRVIRPAALQAYLESEVPRRVQDLKLANKVNQSPDAILTVHPYWLSHIDGVATPPAAKRAGAAAPSPMRGGSIRLETSVPRTTLRSVTRTLVRSAGQELPGLQREIARARTSLHPEAERLAENIEQIAAPFGPDHFETECGFKVRGANLVECFAPAAKSELLGTELARISALKGPAASAVLRFDNDRGAVIPALAGFIAALTFQDGELVDVSYEPSSNNWRWSMYAGRAEELRTLRAVAASASLRGRFRLDDDDALNVARKMQYAKGVDPTFAVYAAYAYHDLQALDRIREMSGYLRGDLGVTFFDLALLGRQLVDKNLDAQAGVVPFVPLLSHGWALLRANRFKLHPKLDGVSETLVNDSLWSLYSMRGLDKLKEALASGDLR
ncbi:MAG TPA: hypothetical protein VFU13_11380 [Steroidobacteraceae bacterium]|nr:hypothetical protein [Steroidobacteraceae bacterium]